MRKSLIAICLVLSIIISLFPVQAGAKSTDDLFREALERVAKRNPANQKLPEKNDNNEFTIDGVTYKEDAYKTLKEGSRGDLVKAAQKRLIELDYLMDKADGVFGSKTANAVYFFQSTNEMERTGTLYFDTMKLLIAGSPKPYVEDPFCVYFTYANWKMSGSNKMVFKPKIHNTSTQRTVGNVHLDIKALDSNGNTLDINGNVASDSSMYMDQRVTIKPGQTAELPGFTLSGRKNIREVHCAIAWVTFDDGSIVYPEIEDQYHTWEIGW